MRLPLLVFHITAGVLAMLAGAAAVSFRKGSRWHGRTGNIFVVAMLTMAVAASFLAFMKHQSNNVFGGILTIYLVATAWATARRRDRRTNILDWLGCLFALTFGVLGIFQGWQKMAGRVPVDDGTYPFMQLFMSGVILLAGIGDLRVIFRGISGRPRIARHLWRMCFGWFIATGSFFLGQQQVFPKWLQGSPLRMIPALLPLALLIFWLVRIRFTKAYKRISIPVVVEATSPSA
jgi:uncharacterized membrane protein